jgi:hypothetical protein
MENKTEFESSDSYLLVPSFASEQHSTLEPLSEFPWGATGRLGNMAPDTK